MDEKADEAEHHNHHELSSEKKDSPVKKAQHHHHEAKKEEKETEHAQKPKEDDHHHHETQTEIEVLPSESQKILNKALDSVTELVSTPIDSVESQIYEEKRKADELARLENDRIEAEQKAKKSCPAANKQ